MSTDQPPEVLVAGDVSLVRYRGGETQRLLEAVGESHEHLRPWMPWASTEPTFHELDDFVTRAVSQWTSGEAFNYWFSHDAAPGVVGGGGLHRRIGEGALEIGYWVHARWTNRGIASAAAAALTSAGLALEDIERIEIRCDEANLASAAVPRRLGYRLERIVDDSVTAPGESGRSMLWVTDSTSWNRPR